MSWTDKKVSYGIDLDGDHLVVSRAMAVRRDFQYEVVCDMGLPAETGESAKRIAELESIIKRGRTSVAGSMPVGLSVARWLTTPFPSVSKARKVLPALLDIQLPFPVESCVCRYLQVARDGNHVRALALAARRESISQRLKAFREQAVEPVVLDHEGLAIWGQSLAELPIEPSIVRVVAHVGQSRTTLVVGRGLQFESAHACQIGLRHLDASSGANPDDVEEAITELAGRAQRVMRAHMADPVPQAIQWVWSGRGAAVPSCVTQLQPSLDFGLPTTFLTHTEPLSFLARALARRVLLRGDETCDFRAGELAHAQTVERAGSEKARVAGSYLLFGLLLCALSGAWLGLLHYRDTEAQAELGRCVREINPRASVQYGQEVRAAERAVAQQEPLRQPFLRAFRPSVTVTLNAVLGTAHEVGIKMETLSLRPDYISINGVSENWADCERLVDVLREQGFILEEPERQDAGADERVHFNIRGSSSG